MTDKQTILIAGATGSIGGGAAVALAKRGARVVLLGRKLETLEAKADFIRGALCEEQIEFQDEDIATLAFDFSDMESVRLAAVEAMDRFPQIHGLILSVGAMVQKGPNILPTGHELMLATNVMGPFLFTQLLIERLQQSNGLVLHVVNSSNRAIDWESGSTWEQIRHMAGSDSGGAANTSMEYFMRLPRARLSRQALITTKRLTVRFSESPGFRSDARVPLLGLQG